MAEHAPPAGVTAPPPEAASLAAPPPRARWVGELRTITRTVEGPGGELVEVAVEHQPAEYVQGVPARDLSADEYDALTDEQRHLVDTCGLYERAGAAEAEPAPAAAPAEAEEA